MALVASEKTVEPPTVTPRNVPVSAELVWRWRPSQPVRTDAEAGTLDGHLIHEVGTGDIRGTRSLDDRELPCVPDGLESPHVGAQAPGPIQRDGLLGPTAIVERAA